MPYPMVLTYKSRDGKHHGIELQERDIEFITLAARWFSITLDHYIRWTEPEEFWLPYVLSDELDPELEHEYWRKKRNIGLRVGKLLRLTGASVLGRQQVRGNPSAFWATITGGQLIGAPWLEYPRPNPMFYQHIWAASDIGRQIEKHGVIVYSEREFAHGLTVGMDDVLGGKFVNARPDSRAPNDIGIRPDLAIAGENGDKFVLVEVERAKGKTYAHYEKKLASYFAHPRVGAVWYIAEHPSTARRIMRLYNEMQATRRYMPVVVGKLEYGKRANYAYSPGDFRATPFIDTLEMVGAYNNG